VVDMFVKDARECIEVETLYGAGFNPLDKIDHETLRRYLGHGVRKVKVVVLPLPFLIYLKQLIELRELYGEKYGIDVEFYTINLKEERLVPMSEVIDQLRENLVRKELKTCDFDQEHPKVLHGQVS